MPASITRAPPASVRAVTRSSAAFASMASAMRHARSLRPSPASRTPALPPIADPLLAPPRHDGQPPPHPRARLIADAATNHDLAAGHAAAGSRQGASGVLAGVAVHVDPSSRHRHAQITAAMALDHQLTARHPRADPLRS